MTQKIAAMALVMYFLLPATSRGEAPGDMDELLAAINSNSEETRVLLERISDEGCSRKLQEDTIKLVANMTRNIQVMTEVIVRMGYNIEEMSRTPKAMNSFPFMP